MQVSQIEQFDTHAVIGGGQAQAFRIVETPEFFTVLSDTLYRDKKRAVVREVICNAWDAHIMVGKTDVPVEITLSEDSLSIKDVGPGIASDMIGPIYCSYGASTKVKDDKQTGGFGLGCKAPFAYSDHFTVTSCHAGKRTLFAISRGSSETAGKPDFRPMVSVPTSESGITVSIPLKSPDDENEFERLIHQIVRDGGILARLNGEDLYRHDYTKARQTGFALMPADGYNYREASVYLLYGTVLYPVSTTDKEITLKANTLAALIERDAKVVLVTEPNTIGVQPSREGLSFSELTTTTVTRLLDRATAMIRHRAPTVARRIMKRFLLKQEMDRYNLHVPTPSSSNSKLSKILADPTAIVERAVRERFNSHLSAHEQRKIAMQVFAKRFRDSRRTFRRGGANLGYKLNKERFRHSRRLFLRLAADLGLLNDLLVFSSPNGHARWESKKIDEFKDERVLQSRLFVAPTRKAIDAALRVETKEKFSCGKTGRFSEWMFPALVLNSPSAELLAQIKTLCERFKIELTVLDFPKRRKKSEKVGDLFVGLCDLKKINYSIGATKATVSQPTSYIRVGGTMEKLDCHFLRDEETLQEYRKIFPGAVVAWTMKQEAKLKARKIPQVADLLLDELRTLTTSREVQYLTMASGGHFLEGGEGWRTPSGTLKRLIRKSPKIAKMFFPDRVKLTGKHDRIAFLSAHFKQIFYDGYSSAKKDEYQNLMKNLAADSRKTFQHLILKNSDVDKHYPFLTFFFRFEEIEENEEMILDTLRFLQRRHTKTATHPQPKKEAA